jgi:hypothetical protein
MGIFVTGDRVRVKQNVIDPEFWWLESLPATVVRLDYAEDEYPVWVRFDGIPAEREMGYYEEDLERLDGNGN